MYWAKPSTRGCSVISSDHKGICDVEYIQWQVALFMIDIKMNEWAVRLQHLGGSLRKADLQPAEAAAVKKEKWRWRRRGPFQDQCPYRELFLGTRVSGTATTCCIHGVRCPRVVHDICVLRVSQSMCVTMKNYINRQHCWQPWWIYIRNILAGKEVENYIASNLM